MGGDASCQNFVPPTVHGDAVEDVTVTIKVVSWNIAKREQPWHELVQMAREGHADVALLQEAGGPPGELVDTVAYPEGASEVGERFGCAATDSVHQQLVRGGGMRRSPANSTNRSLAAFGKLQHIPAK